MARGKNKKKNNKNNAFFKAVKPLVKNNRVLFSLLGAAGLVVALTAAFRSEKGQVLVDKVAGKARDFTYDIRRNKSDSPVRRSVMRWKQPAKTESRRRFSLVGMADVH